MEINKEKIEEIALLARLELSDKEIDVYQRQFKDILNFVDILQEVDCSNVEFLGIDNQLDSQLRDDIVRDCPADERKTAIDQSPGMEDDQFKVSRVL